MGAEVMCRICKEHFDREKEKENEYWVRPNQNVYYHKRCYDNWRNDSSDIKAQISDEEWENAIYDFFACDLKVKYDFQKCRTQMKSFVKKYKYTYKGMFFSLKYFYEVKKGDWLKSQNGVGIIPFIYNEAANYWEKRFLENNQIISEIEQQILNRAKRPKVVVNQRKSKTKRKKNIKIFNLDDIPTEE